MDKKQPGSDFGVIWLKFFAQVHHSCPILSSPSPPVLLCNRHKYLCRYVTHIRLQYFRLFPVLHSQLSRCQLSGSYGATAPCLHTYAQSILNHCHCNTHTHTFLTKGKLCICQGHGPNKGEVLSSVLRCDELCRLHASTPSSHTHIHILYSSAPYTLLCCMLKQILSLLDWAKLVFQHSWIETERRGYEVR